ncbi:MAG TPA: class I SAM-dependent methyltransferase [Acidimicrobiales bacterium]|nr:class I SAM-dependent methyltransferase [Acidimicrobiales bacterium]
MAAEPQHDVLRLEDGRRLFGLDPSVYEAGRPQYPPALYAALRERCGLTTGTRVLEIGPGTGLVTRELLAAGASVVAVEPNANLAAFLTDGLRAAADLDVVEAVFEDAVLEDDAFDLAVAATSFHWVEQERGLGKLRRVVRPGGSVALWWTLYQDPTALDEFSRAAEPILGSSNRFAFEEQGRPPFQLDAERRLQSLRTWGGFVDVESQVIRTKMELDAAQVRALYASVATVLRLAPEKQTSVLDGLEALVRDTFGGRVERTFVTALYTGRRPFEAGASGSTPTMDRRSPA